MNYVVRILDLNGRLKKERIMFNAVRILDSKGNLKKIIRSKILSQKHWEGFSNYLKTKHKKINKFNVPEKGKTVAV